MRSQWSAFWSGLRIVAQIEFLEKTENDYLRTSKVVGLRNDKNPRHVSKDAQAGALNPEAKRVEKRRLEPGLCTGFSLAKSSVSNPKTCISSVPLLAQQIAS
jgi:hypothetical protein